MATGPQYVKVLNNHQRANSVKLGIVLAQMPIEPRAVLQLANMPIVAIALLLVTKGVITEQELVAAINASDDWVIPAEKTMPETPDDPPPGP